VLPINIRESEKAKERKGEKRESLEKALKAEHILSLLESFPDQANLLTSKQL
jgi:hypothetical protein